MTRKSTNPNKIYESISYPIESQNTFDKTHMVAMTGKVGTLMPVLTMPVVPGDRVRLEYDLLVRFPALVAPAMTRFDAYIHTYYVPNRVVWQGFDEFFQEEDGYTVPTFEVEDALTTDQERFLDYLGIPPIADSTGKHTYEITAFAAACYQKIYNDYYRPRPFQDPVSFLLPTAGGAIGDAARNLLLVSRQRSWEHDYFTSMLPEPMVAPDVTLGVGDVTLKSTLTGTMPFFQDETNTLAQSGALSQVIGVNTTIQSTVPGGTDLWLNPNGSLEVEATTMNALRVAWARQKYLEKMGRAGGEYYEIIMALYGKRIGDARLQRAEYITGMKAPVLINPVLSTTEVTDYPIGQQAGHAICYGNGGNKSYNIEEHGHIMAIFSLIPKPMYKQGIPRHYRAFSIEDYIIPDLANIGEQPVYGWELAAYEEAASAITTVGYMPNYTHHKQMQSRIAGEFRSSLAHYVVVKEYAGIPTLDTAFIQVPTDIADHIFVTESGINDPLWINVLCSIDHTTCLPVYGDPK